MNNESIIIPIKNYKEIAMKKLLLSISATGLLLGSSLTHSSQQPTLAQDIVSYWKDGLELVKPNLQLAYAKWDKIALLYANKIVTKFGIGMLGGAFSSALKDHKVLPETNNYYGKLFCNSFSAVMPFVMMSDDFYSWFLGKAIDEHAEKNIVAYLTTNKALAKSLKVTDDRGAVTQAKVSDIAIINKDKGRLLGYAAFGAGVITSLLLKKKLQNFPFKKLVPFAQRA